MDLLKKILARAKADKQRIVLPEATEERTLKAADKVLADELADIILIGNPYEIGQLAVKWDLNNIDKATIIDPLNNPKSEEYGEAGSLLITGVRGSMLPSWFYCPYLDGQNTATGSYVYGGVWHQYDQILASYRLFDGVGWEFESFRVCDLPSLVGGDGRPKAWNVQLLDGVSDHLPVLMTLKRR